MIQELSAGIPRLINSLCENALILGFAQGEQTIDAAIITAVAADLHLACAKNNIPVNEAGRKPPLTGPVRVNAQPATIQTAMPTLERYTPRRGWRVLFGLD